MNVCRKLSSRQVKGRDPRASELSHEVAEFEDHVLTSAVRLLRQGHVLRSTSVVVGRQEDDSEAHVDGLRLELFDQRSALMRMSERMIGSKPEAFEGAGEFFAKPLVAAVYDENGPTVGRRL